MLAQGYWEREGRIFRDHRVIAAKRQDAAACAEEDSAGNRHPIGTGGSGGESAVAPG